MVGPYFRFADHEMELAFQVTCVAVRKHHSQAMGSPLAEQARPLSRFRGGPAYSHRFVVIQPTHLNSKVAGLPANYSGGPLFWRSRVEDMKLILDELDKIEAMVPAVEGRIHHSKVAAVGHSLGGQTVGMLLGARLTDPKDEAATDVNMIEPRIGARHGLGGIAGYDAKETNRRGSRSFGDRPAPHLGLPALDAGWR